MAKQRMLSTGFWSDPWVVDELNPLDRYLFLYLLTNEKTNIIGVYEMSLRTMSNETGIEKEELLRMLKRLESRVVYVMGWVVFRKAIKHQNYKSPKIVAGIARELENVPNNVLQYMELPNNFGEFLQNEYGIDTVSSGITPNLTKPNLTKPNLTKPNELSPKPVNPKSQVFKTNYRKAADADRALSKRESEARLRKPTEQTGYKQAQLAAELIKQKVGLKDAAVHSSE